MNDNLSVAVGAPTTGRPSQLGSPSLAFFQEDDDSSRLGVVDVDRTPGHPIELRLLGRSTRQEVVVPFTDDGVTLTAEILTDSLAKFGHENIDIFVTGTYQGQLMRSRIRVGDYKLPEVTRSGSARRWYATTDGHLSSRHQTAQEAIAESGVFDERYYREQCPELESDADAIEHYVRIGASRGLNPSAMFDSAYYRRMNRDVRGNPLAHYCEYGWKELRNPSPLFDTWWYWSKHLDLADETINPLAHYESIGKFQAVDTAPSQVPSRGLGTGETLPTDRQIRRICLFAAYDADGIVDDYVVEYVRELSRHSDVYYWADCDMQPGELEKLDEVTVAARAERHGEYDFGSYSRLVNTVGWDTLEEYDEMLLINDSCFLLRPLDQVFNTMRSKACDWWGLQATKGIYQTRNHAVNLFRDPIPVDTARGSLVDAFERDYIYDFHVGSYFLAYRQPVLKDPEFRRYLSSVTAQSRKRNVVRKYEVGLTRWLIQHGHQFDTFITNVYPYHPLFSLWHFRMIDDGFPLFKRYLLTENHLSVPHLWDWASRIVTRVPDADVAMFERNLKRIADPAQLRRNLSIGRSDAIAEDPPVPARLLSNAEFAEADRTSPKHANWWVFPVCAYSRTLSGNERAIFERVKDDASIHKIILTRDRAVDVDGVNVEILPLESPEGQYQLMRAGTILVRHTAKRNVNYPVSSELHNLIQVWHGIPYKRVGYASSDFFGILDRVAAEQSQYRAVISSSRIDALAMTAAFYPLTYHQVWNTGLPRNDFIMRPESQLPEDFLRELSQVREIVAGRRLVLFMPTFRNSQSEGSYTFSESEIAWLKQWLEKTDSVLGIREHMADVDRTYGTQFETLPTVDLSDEKYPNVEVLYRASDALITDYSSAFIDYMLTGKPAISFAYDYEAYLLERGGFYDLDQIFPGPICKTFGDLQDALQNLESMPSDPTYEFKRRMFFDHLDDQNSDRVVERLRNLAEIHGLGKWPGERWA